LTQIAPAVMAGGGAWSITIDSAGHNAYVANRDADTVSHFTIDPTTGALTLANTLLLPAGTGPTSVAIDPSGLFAYIADRGQLSPQATISQCSVAADGTLALLTPPTAPAGNSPAAIITSR
jgi:6-phosphogluconolactonase